MLHLKFVHEMAKKTFRNAYVEQDKMCVST